MNYVFPAIAHIDDILNAIEGRKEFIHVKKDDYQVISYVVNSDDTFPEVNDVVRPEEGMISLDRKNSLLRECRGLIFDNDGNLLRRSFHKFFNLNEKPECHVDMLDFTKPHSILVKLDGSMITPIKLKKNHIRWASKLGISDTAMQAECFVATHPNYLAFAKECIDSNLTPIFEWCSRQNRIVLDYPEDSLILTGIRQNYLGNYLDYDLQQYAADEWNIPCVPVWYNGEFNLEFLENLKKSKDIEGVVVRFQNGHMVKVKTDEYIKIHRAKDIISQEHDIAHLILRN